MKLLLLGATGNLGCRLVPALLTHGHNVTVYVRSAKKLETTFPSDVVQRLTAIEGDATDCSAIRKAILESRADAVVSAAGVAAVAPWASSTLPAIFRAVVQAAQQASAERGSPLRLWMLGGTGVLYFPGTESMLSNYIPIYLEHRGNVGLLRSLPPHTLDWSMLCPMTMVPESSDLSVPFKSSKQPLMASAGTPPRWHASWIDGIPFLGRMISVAMNSSRYETTLEQNAEFIAKDLEDRDSRWIGTTVGIIDETK